MKLLLVKFAALLMLVPAWFSALAADTSETEVTRLTLVFNDNTEKHFNLSECPEITFEDTQIHIKNVTIETSANRVDVKHFHFTKGSPVVAVKDIATDITLSFSYLNNIATVCAPLLKNIAVYDTLGRLCFNVAAGTDGTAVADLNSLAQGVYLIVIPGENTIKVVKK